LKKYRYEYHLNEITPYPLPDHSLFLDIETTGFQRTSTFLTIIGLAWQDKDIIIIEQWLNETGQQEEPLLLLELEHFLTKWNREHGILPKLIHYNGTTFDLPYLKSKYEQYHLPSSLLECTSLDLYHLAKKYRHFLSLDGIKQKNLEECFGLFREDKLSGQELVESYLNSIKHQDPQLLEAYLLHNKEDMEGMVFLQNLVRLDSFFAGHYEVLEWKVNESGDSVFLKLNGDFHLYKPISVSSTKIHFIFEKGTVQIQIPICHMEARFFYDNYKDYYYLPLEDCAMHKSVAGYVEKEYRIKATKETCYTKKTDHFLPLPLPESARLRKKALQECCSLQLFYEAYGDITAYVLKTMEDICNRKIYINRLLQSVL